MDEHNRSANSKCFWQINGFETLGVKKTKVLIGGQTTMHDLPFLHKIPRINNCTFVLLKKILCHSLVKKWPQRHLRVKQIFTQMKYRTLQFTSYCYPQTHHNCVSYWKLQSNPSTIGVGWTNPLTCLQRRMLKFLFSTHEKISKFRNLYLQLEAPN